MPQARCFGSHLDMFIGPVRMHQAPRLSQLTYVSECPVPPANAANAVGVHDFRQRLLRRGRVYVPPRYIDYKYTLVPSRQSFLADYERVGSRPSPDYVLESGSSVMGDEYLKVLSCELDHERFTVQPTRAVAGWPTGLFPRPFRWPHRVPGWIHKPPARHASAGISGQA